jgi:hypothetical protein
VLHGIWIAAHRIQAGRKERKSPCSGAQQMILERIHHACIYQETEKLGRTIGFLRIQRDF